VMHTDLGGYLASFRIRSRREGRETVKYSPNLLIEMRGSS
jgi:hypothetical protein